MTGEIHQPDWTLGVGLRTLRIRRGLSLAQAANLGKVSKSALAGWEAERRTPPGEGLEGLLNAYRASPREVASFLAIADPGYARVAYADDAQGPPVGMGEVLRSMRLRRDMTQTELAKILGVAQSSVARWERGDLEIDAEVRQTILRALHASFVESEAVASLDPYRRIERSFEARYEMVTKSPHELGETLWLGLEADLWWHSRRSDRYDELYQRVINHRADWYALSIRPRESVALIRRAMAGSWGPSPDVPQGVAYAIVHSALQMGTPPEVALCELDEWASRLRTPESVVMVKSLRAFLVAKIDMDQGILLAQEARRNAGDEPLVLDFTTHQLARLHLMDGAPHAALDLLEESVHIDALTLKAQATVDLGLMPSEEIVDAVRRRRASRQVPLYRKRLEDIENGMSRLLAAS